MESTSTYQRQNEGGQMKDLWPTLINGLILILASWVLVQLFLIFMTMFGAWLDGRFDCCYQYEALRNMCYKGL